MTKLIIVSHGDLAESFKRTVSMIAGEEMASQITCICMTPDMDPEQFEAKAADILSEDPEGDYLIFADLFAASPCNTCVSVFRSASYRMVTGVNLGVLLDILYETDTLPLDELYTRALETAKDAVRGVTLHV